MDTFWWEHQACHGNSLLAAYQETFPMACDRSDYAENPPSSQQLNYLARLREELESDEGSGADEDAAAQGGWTGVGRPMQVGLGYTVRGHCDGQSLASPGGGQ